MNSLWSDIRYGLRTLAKNPGFSAVAVITLALGIGASTSIFSVVDAVLLRPLPYPNPRQIITVEEQEAHGHYAHLADPNFLDFRAENHTLSGLAMFTSIPQSVSGGSEPVRVNIGLVSQDFFKVLGVEPFRGHTFTRDEIVEHGAPAIIVSYAYWRQYLGAKNDLSRTRLAMNGTVYPVIGVMPSGFDYPSGVAGWIAWERYGWGTSRTSHDGMGLGRLRDGVTLEQARTDIDTIARRIHVQYGANQNEDYFIKDAIVAPFADYIVGDVRGALLTLFGAVLLLFLVAAANVVGLLLARTAAQRKELAVRAALGAGRSRLVQQLLAESMVLSLVGGVIGILLAIWTTSLLPAIVPADLPRHQEIAVNDAVLLFTVAATLLVAIGLGLFTARRAGRVDLSDALNAASRGYSSARQKSRKALVIAEIAATLMLLITAGLLGRSFMRLISVSPGFSGQNLLVMKFSLPMSQDEGSFQRTPEDIGRQSQFVDKALARIRAIPGIESAGVTGALPIADADGFPDGEFLILNGQPAPTTDSEWDRFSRNKSQIGEADYAVASEGFFRAAGISLIRGRLFGPQDGPDAPHVALISETLDHEKWPRVDPIGQVIFFGNMDGIMKPLTIVGVVGDVRAEGLEQPSTPIIYVDYRQRGLGANSSPAIIMRTALPAATVIPPARAVFRQLDPDIPVQFSTFAEALGGWMAQKRFLLLLASLFACAALLLAAVGIYGLVANSVARRTQEIGIRIALGAQRRDVLRMVIGESAQLALIGIAIGVALSLAASRLISSLLFGVKAVDPLTFIVVSAMLGAVALLASYVPARRAMRVDPVVALRHE